MREVAVESWKYNIQYSIDLLCIMLCPKYIIHPLSIYCCCVQLGCVPPLFPMPSLKRLRIHLAIIDLSKKAVRVHLQP